MTGNRNTEGDRSLNLRNPSQNSLVAVCDKYTVLSHSESDVCIFVLPDASRALCERGFWVGNVTARHQSQTDSGDQTLMWHLPIQLTRRAHPSLICSDSWKTHTQTHTLKTDGSADSHSMIEKHLQGPDSISLPLKRGADDGVVALCHYDVKHNVSDALCFI